MAESIDELDRLNCDCGYGFAVLSVAEASPAELSGGEVVPIRQEDERSESQRRAA